MSSRTSRSQLELQHKIQKSRPWMRSPSSPLTTWGAWSTGAKLPPPSEADSYNSSSIKVIFVTPTFLPQFIFISFLFLYNDNIQTPEVSGPSCQWPWDRWIWMQSETVGFYFLETHSSFISWQWMLIPQSTVIWHLSVALFIWSIEPLATLWRHLGGGWRTQINGNIKQHLNLSLVSVD